MPGKSSNLRTSPNFTFYQERSDDVPETPINVTFYNGGIDFEQEGSSVYIADEFFESFVKAVRSMKREADDHKEFVSNQSKK